jgi:type III secretion protein U
MAGQDETEEKILLPSQTKINKLRREGNVPRSRDSQAAASVAAVLVYLGIFRGHLLADLHISIDSAMTVFGADQATPVTLLIGSAWAIFRDFILVPMLVGVVAAVIVGLIDGKGLPVSMKAMQLDFSRLSPSEGLKKIFKIDNLSEFLKAIVKLVIITALFVAIFLHYLNDILWAPLCGEICSVGTSAALFRACLSAGALVMLISAFFDIGLARALFRREHRMTRSEAKRENKENMGDPHMRYARSRLGKEILNDPPNSNAPKAENVTVLAPVASGHRSRTKRGLWRGG